METSEQPAASVDDSQPNENEESKSSDAAAATDADELEMEKQMDRAGTIEEFLINTKARLLDYEKHMFLDILDSDGIVICAKGISYERVVLNLLKVHCDPGNLIIVLNSSDYEERYYRRHLDPKHVRDTSTNGNDREMIYLLGGIHFISTQILVVDLLKKRIPIDLITGIVVLRAHEVIESCQEAFALRVYRQSNKTGFVKAFTSCAEEFTYGYGHIEKVMRNLFVKELFIWPRFHMYIQKSLKQFEPTMIELNIPMTERMRNIQRNLLEIMNFLVKEVKRMNRFVDMEEVTVENCVTKRFHKILQSQLDCVWHQLNSQTKLLISDLKVLRSLVFTLINSDAVSFYATMKRYRTQEYAMNNSGWILSDAAEQVFSESRNRVYNSKDEFEPESSPKWEYLSDILRVEIPADVRKCITANPKSANKSIVVLILCQDSRTCYELSQYLTQGGERYLLFNAMKNDVPVKKLSEAYKQVKESDINSIKLQTSVAVAMTLPKPSSSTRSAIPSSSKVSKAKASSSSTIESILKKKKNQIEDDEMTKKDEEDEGDGAAVQQDELSALTADDAPDFSFYRQSYLLTLCESNETDPSDGAEESFDISNLSTGRFESFAELENLDITQIIQNHNKPIVCIQTFRSGEDGPMSLPNTLQDIQPQYLVMYHINVAAIRQIEVFEAQQCRAAANRLKVFFLTHLGNVEEQCYLTNLRREKQAYELLIDTKKTMVVPEYQDGKADESVFALQREEAAGGNSRQAGGQQQTVEGVTPKIVVDIREFRSDLPCLIHRRGIEVVPMTITIGDYILTPDICVERKSISDLIGSLNSGRLYTQCIQMTRYYKKAILLIEFDQNKPFHLQGHYLISGESSVSNIDITQKLQLLTIHFPKLKLVWSPSPYATAQLFGELKQGKPEPDATQAAAVGSDDSVKELDNIIDRLNTNIHDFLLKLPGINTRNVTKVMANVRNLRELIKMDEKQLSELLSSDANAKMLHEILHVTHKPVEEGVANKQFMSKFKQRGRRF